MARFFIVRNAYKAPVRRVFDYLDAKTLEKPNEKQKKMLEGICDGIDFFESDRNADAKSRMKEGDYLYEVSYDAVSTNFVSLYPPKKQQ